jgi:hypothetical protein
MLSQEAPRARRRSADGRVARAADMIDRMDFTLSDDDAAALRHMASIEPMDARRWLQDRPELAQRMLSWPPELRLEICRILYRSFGEDRRAELQARRRPGSSLLDQLERDP